MMIPNLKEGDRVLYAVNIDLEPIADYPGQLGPSRCDTFSWHLGVIKSILSDSGAGPDRKIRFLTRLQICPTNPKIRDDGSWIFNANEDVWGRLLKLDDSVDMWELSSERRFSLLIQERENTHGEIDEPGT